MTGLPNSHWQQWEKQENERKERLAYVELNNLYLRIEKGQVDVTIHTANRLNYLVCQAYKMSDPMREWWADEFTKLPGWFDV